MNLLYKIPIKVWQTVSGLVMLPFGITISIIYIVFSLLILRMPDSEHMAHTLTEKSIYRIIGM